MRIFSGQIFVDETRRAIPGLTVSVYRIDAPPSDGERENKLLLGSGATDSNGAYHISTDMEDLKLSPVVRLEVTPLSDRVFPRPEPLFNSIQPTSFTGNVNLSIRFSQESLSAAGVMPTIGTGNRLAARAGQPEAQTASGGNP